MTDQSFAYEKINQGIRILRCYGTSGRVVIPSEIEGLPVTELSDYVFAKEMEKEPENDSGLPCICGLELEELHLPDTVVRLGRYLFYNCIHFKKLCFYSNIAFIGAGAFTGCDHLTHLVMHWEEGISCLREILQDLKQTVLVDCYQAGQEKMAYRLVYPEFFEEAMENTPARITYTQTHGMGIQYRNAFRGTQVIFREYDRLFETGKYNMDLITIIEMATSRLCYPYELEDEARKQYDIWLREHLKESAETFIEREKWEELRWMVEEFAETKAQVEELIQVASDKSDAEAVSMLLDVAHRRFAGKKKRFEL